MFKRILALLLVTGGLAAFYYNPLEPRITAAGEVDPQLVTTKARDLNLVCPGALYQVGGSSGTSLEVARVGEAATVGYFDNEAGLTLVEQRTAPDAPVLAGHVDDRLVEGKSITVLDPEGKAVQGSKLLSISQYQNVKLSNLSGLAATNCMRPTNDAWLVGGDTTAGRETLLILVNPSNVDSSVNLELYGPTGKVVASGLSSISAPKSKTTVIPISSLVPDSSTFSVHVEASGGALGVWLQTRTVRGLLAGGVDYVAAASDPSNNQVIPGVFIRGSVAAARLAKANSAYLDLAPVLRIQNPNNDQVTVTGQLLGTTATTFGTVIQQVIPPNSTVDIPIEGLSDGDYSAFVDSSLPVRAAIRLNRTIGTGTDLAWLPAVTPTTERVVTSAPAGSITKLSIANPGNKLAQVTVSGKAYKVAAQSSISIVFTPGTSWSISSDQQVAASAVIDFAGAFSVVPVIDYKNLGGKLAITVR